MTVTSTFLFLPPNSMDISWPNIQQWMSFSVTFANLRSTPSITLVAICKMNTPMLGTRCWWISSMETPHPVTEDLDWISWMLIMDVTTLVQCATNILKCSTTLTFTWVLLMNQTTCLLVKIVNKFSHPSYIWSTKWLDQHCDSVYEATPELYVHHQESHGMIPQVDGLESWLWFHQPPN